jgi:Fe-S cluster assembly protein SufB
MLAGVVRPKASARRGRCRVRFGVGRTTFKEELEEGRRDLLPISEAIREHPELVKKYLGSVVPTSDNYFATLNSAVFSDGSFVYVPKGVRCPMELSTYFRINEEHRPVRAHADHRRQGRYVSYLEGCTAPQRDENQLHAAVVELVALDDAEIKYSTVQNWYPGDAEGKGGIYNFVTKRGDCRGEELQDFVDAGRNRFGDHLEISELHPARRRFAGRVLFDRDLQRLPAGRHRHQDDPSRQEHVEPHHLQGHRRGRSQNTYRGQVSAHRKATGARNFTKCDSLLIGDKCGAHTVPYIEAKNLGAKFEHEATTSKISEDQLFYCRQRGLSEEEAVALSSTASSRTCCRTADGIRGRGAEIDRHFLEGSVG